MLDDENVGEVLRHYFKLVLAANGLALSEWGYARSVHDVARRVLERRYFSPPDLSPQEETEILTALEELDKSPIKQVGVPGMWWEIQARLRRVVPLAVRLLNE
jgi:hypothetical protein